MTIPANVVRSPILRSVSRETWERLETIVDLMLRWNRKINLISRSTEDDIWHRHILDSAQITHYAHEPTNWIDLGSGGGLPGLIVASILAETSPRSKVTLVESDRRKSAFLIEATRLTSLKVHVETRRIEDAGDQVYDVVSARALAPLPKLLDLAAPYLAKNARCLFMKGEAVEAELTAARQSWHMKVTTHRSLTDPRGSILCVEELTHA